MRWWVECKALSAKLLADTFGVDVSKLSIAEDYAKFKSACADLGNKLKSCASAFPALLLASTAPKADGSIDIPDIEVVFPAVNLVESCGTTVNLYDPLGFGLTNSHFADAGLVGSWPKIREVSNRKLEESAPHVSILNIQSHVRRMLLVSL